MPGATPALVGRTAEMHAARAVLDRARRGLGGLVVIEGEPGIGKSRLVEEIITVARREHFQVLDVACEMAEQSTPFAPVRRLLRADGPFPGDATTTDPDDEATPALRFRVIEALGALVEAMAARDPLVIAIDDLQWADESTLLAVRSLGPRIEPLPVVLVGTHRPGHGMAELHRLTEAMLRGGALRLELGPLDDESVTALAAAAGGEASESLRTRLRGAAGNPLFITELARAVADDAGSPPDLRAAQTVPVAFRQSVLRRLGQLPTSVQDLLRIAAVLGSSFDSRHLSIVLGRSAIDLAPLIDRALTAGVIEERREQLGFKHDLVREAVYENIPSGVRRDLHREVGRLLADAGADVLVVAQHVGLGADRVDPDAAAWLRRAATEAAPLAPGVAADLLERARELLPPSSPDLTDVLTDLALAYAWSGRMADAEAVARDVLSGRADPGQTTAMRAGLLRALTWQGRPAEALAQVGLQLEERADGFDAAMLAAETALAAASAFDFPRAVPTAARAEQSARASRNDVALCQALSVQAWLTTFLGRPHDSVKLVHEALAIADASPGGSAHRAHPCFFAGMPLQLLDRLDEAARYLQEGRRRAEERGLVWSLPLYHSHLGATKFTAGEWDAAVAELEAALAVADEIGLSSPVVAAAAAWLSAIQLHRDDVAGAEQTIAAALGRMVEGGPQGGPILSWARAMLHEARGELDAAIALLQGAFDMFMTGGNMTDPWSVMALVRLLMRTGDVERATALIPVVERQAAMTGTAFMRAQALRCRGLVEGDAEILLEAVAEYRSCPRPLELAAGCEDAGLALADSGRVDDGVVLLEEALNLYENVGAARDIARVRSALRRNGVRRAGGRRVTRTVSGWDSLTDTELKVVELVAQRLSNPEVAERLFISRHTVESHLKRIYRKLGVASRTKLATEANSRRVANP